MAICCHVVLRAGKHVFHGISWNPSCFPRRHPRFCCSFLDITHSLPSFVCPRKAASSQVVSAHPRLHGLVFSSLLRSLTAWANPVCYLLLFRCLFFFYFLCLLRNYGSWWHWHPVLKSLFHREKAINGQQNCFEKKFIYLSQVAWGCAETWFSGHSFKCLISSPNNDKYVRSYSVRWLGTLIGWWW